MKVFVLCEDPSEQERAQNLADVLVNMSGMLAEAKVGKDGGVTITHGGAIATPVPVEAVDPRELFDRVTRWMLGVG